MAATTKAKRKKKILLIDDEPEVIESLESLLRVKGFEVVSASNGEEGLRKAKLENPALILLDIVMPGMDGHQVLNRLRASRETSQIPVIMLTAKEEMGSIIKAQKARAVDYFTKPVEAEGLLEVIQKTIKLYEAEDLI